MSNKLKTRCWPLLVLCVGLQLSAAAQTTGKTFSIGDSSFLLNGKPFVIRCGEMHFARIPKAYWRHRLQMAKAMGLNAVCAYLFWNLHEKEPGQFSWEGQADAAAFCKMAQEEGLYVILRPGPYSCAEWEFGGFPWWLLKDKSMKLRTRHAYYLDRCRSYLKEVGRQLAPLQLPNGGSIIMVQVENEYGSYGNDKEYIGRLRDDIKEAGFTVPLFTCDGPDQLKNDTRSDIFSVVNFGGNPENNFKALRRIRPEGPLMCGEYYPGWFDSWGSAHHTGTSDRVVKELAWMLDHKASFSIYMAHGGTTFGTYSGANAPPYLPQTSSYDYDAPINESGEATDKFYRIRDLFAKHLQPGESLPPVPAAMARQTIAPFTLDEYAPVFNNLPAPVTADSSSFFEDLNLPFGAMLYETALPAGGSARISCKEIHDYALVYVNNTLVGSIDRRKGMNTLAIPARKNNATLRIFVEATGRVNYGGLMHDRKGLYGPVTLLTDGGSVPLHNWKHYPIPLGDRNLPVVFSKNKKTGTGQPGFYRGYFTTQSNADTYLDLSKWGKGLVWVNGICIGRFWNIGPTQTMFLPGCWLKKGKNEVIVFDLADNPHPQLSGSTRPVLDSLLQKQATAHRRPGQQWNEDTARAYYKSSFTNSAEWQSARFTPKAARYFCIEACNAFDEQPYTTIAELELMDENGKPLPRTSWKVLYADSEELSSEDGRADNVFDLQFTSIWHTQWSSASPKHPHQLVLDLGVVKTIGGIRYLPRQDNKNGRVKEYRLYLSAMPFKLTR